MRRQPPGRWANAALADLLDADPSALNNSLRYTESASTLVRSIKDGRILYWELGPGVPPAPPDDEDKPIRQITAPAPQPQQITKTPAPALTIKNRVTRFAYFNDGSLAIMHMGETIELSPESTCDLISFLRRIPYDV